jgi:hypothetical protein
MSSRSVMAEEPGISGRGARGGADVVRERVEVAVRGEDADALDLGAVGVVLVERGLSGGEGASGADRLGADHRGARHGRGEVVRRDGERVRVRQVLTERSAEQREQVAAVDGGDDRPAGGQVGVVDAGGAQGDGGVAVELARRLDARAHAFDGTTEDY